MSHFGWKNFFQLHWKQLSGVLPHGREREILKFLHQPTSLNVLAKRISESAPSFVVDVESIWVDGTPQAEFTDISGLRSNCELADLLLIVRKEQLGGGLVAERGLLLQAKVTPKYNRLTSGKSTVKERRLLERLDRAQKIDLFKDVGLTSPLGKFILGPSVCGATAGLKDCARYLLAPKWANWGIFHAGRAPYQVGWPTRLTSPFLQRPKGFVEAVLDVGVTGRLGEAIGTPGSNGWSNIIAAIRGAYVGRPMRGYGHPRIRVGTAFLSLSTPAPMQNGRRYIGPQRFGSSHLEEPPLDFERLQQEPPAIPIIIVTLRGEWPENS